MGLSILTKTKVREFSAHSSWTPLGRRFTLSKFEYILEVLDNHLPKLEGDQVDDFSKIVVTLEKQLAALLLVQVVSVGSLDHWDRVQVLYSAYEGLAN